MADATEEDLWEAIGGEPGGLDSAESDGFKLNGTNDIEELKEEIETAFAELQRQHERELAKIRSRLNSLESSSEPQLRDTMSTLQKYAVMVEDGMDDAIGTTDRRAVAIYRNWDDLKQKLQSGNYGVTTRRSSTLKNQPSQFKVQLQQILDTQLEWEQIYRAMKAVAKLSGGEPEQTEYGRMKIIGGLFEYHERTSPDNTDSTVYKVLIET